MWKMKHRLEEESQDGGSGGSGGEWFAPEQKDFVANKGWKGPADAITSFQNLEKLMGADKAGRTVVWPKDENDADGWKGVYSRLGVPADPTGYKIPDALKDDPLIGEFAKVAHSANLTPAGFDKVVTQMLKVAGDFDASSQAKAKEASAKELEKLKGEWGSDFGPKSEAARRFLRESGWDDERIARYEETFGTASMLKDFHGWGAKLGEAPFVQGDGKGGMSANKAKIQQEIADLQRRRAAGEVPEKVFMSEMDRLGPLLDAA